MAETTKWRELELCSGRIDIDAEIEASKRDEENQGHPENKNLARVRKFFGSDIRQEEEASKVDRDNSRVQSKIEFEPAIIVCEFKHGEHENLELLGEIYHQASGGDASTKRLDSSISKEFKSPMKNTVLHVAALRGNDEMVVSVAKQDPHLIFSSNINRDTPLHVAARAGHISTLRKLLDTCANSNVTRLLDLMEVENNQGNIMLHEAVMCGGSMGSMIFYLLESYTSVDNSGRSLSQSCYELALNNVNNEHQSVLYLAVEARLMGTVDRILEKCPENAMPKGISPLVAAIMKRDKDMLTVILDKKQEWIHLRDSNGRVPLHCAAAIGYHEGVVYLLDRCKSCSIKKDKHGYVPLHLAAHGGHVEVVKEMLGYCPDPNEMLDPYLNNILHIAAKSAKLDVVHYILQTPELEKMINQKNMFGETPLHVATERCRPKVVYALTWDDRVDLNMVNIGKQTALDLAIAHYASPTQNPSLRRSLTWIALKSAGAKPSPSKAPRFVKITPNFSMEVGNEEKIELREGSGVSRADRFKDRVESLSVISTLIVTASVAACLAVPGEAEGTANNLHKAMFHFFIFCITISLFSSISATVILLWGRLGVIELLDFALKWATPLLGAALITLSLAFLAGVYTVISKLSWLASLFVFMSVIFVAILFVLYILLFLPSSSTGKKWRRISYYPFIFLASLAEERKP